MRYLRIASLACLILLVSVLPTDAQKTVGKWGMGTFMGYRMPVLGLRDWYSETGTLGLTFNYVVSAPVVVEIEYQYSKFAHGSLEGRAFTWAIDGEAYLSPNASSEMTFNSVVVNALIYPGKGPALSRGGYLPYLTVGGGFYHYDSRVENLIYPHQTAEPLDQTLLLRSFGDKRTALGANIAIGLEAFVTDNLAVDLRAGYSFVIGELRPMEAWDLHKQFPLQLFDVRAGLRVYFGK